MTRRGAVLLSAVFPDRSVREWAERPLGERDRALLRLRESLFGSTLDTTTRCEACGETMEAQFRAADLDAPFAAPGIVEREMNGVSVRFRVPSQDDVCNALASNDPREALLKRCVESLDSLNASAVQQIVDAMAEIDAQADIRIQMGCPACGSIQSVSFDIVAHLWGDLNDWARRMLADVHTLARAYGWREDDILAMSALRRRMYLQRIGAEA